MAAKPDDHDVILSGDHPRTQAGRDHRKFATPAPPDVIECPEDCPYCSGEMCARFDGLGCQHDATERHGYPLCYDPSAHEKTAPAAPPDACPHGHFGGYNCPECGDATTAPAAVTYDYQPDDCDHDEWRETCVVCGLTRTPAPAPTGLSWVCPHCETRVNPADIKAAHFPAHEITPECGPMTCTCSTADDRLDWPHADDCALMAPDPRSFMAEVEPCEETHAKGTTHYHVMRPFALDTTKEADRAR